MRPSQPSLTIRVLQRCRTAWDRLSAVEIIAGLGFLWLAAYALTDWARGATLGLILRLELWIADLLGATLRPSRAPASDNEPTLWVVVIVLYCVVSAYLISRRGRPLPTEEDLVGKYETRTNRPSRGGAGQ